MKRMYLLLIVMAMFFIACGPSVDTESKNWEKNKTAVEKLKSEYPAYAQMIDEKMQEAQKIWDKAVSISEEEKKAEEMSRANDLLEKGAVGALKSMKSEIDNLKREKNELQEKIADNPAITQRANDAIKEATDAVKTAEEVIFATGTFTASEAQNKINMAKSRIESAKKSIKSVVKAISKEKTVKKEKEQKEKEKQVEKEKEKAKVKCEYCGTMNEPDATKCKSCGAQLEKK